MRRQVTPVDISVQRMVDKLQDLHQKILIKRKFLDLWQYRLQYLSPLLSPSLEVNNAKITLSSLI